MKSNKNSFFRGISMFLIIFALTFSINAKATTTFRSSNGTSLIATSADVNMIPAHINALTFFLNFDVQAFLASKCKNHGQSGCSICKKTDSGSQSVPLDGGLGILALGAAAFGVRKLRGNKHDKI
jgi:hypothetical protein